ncbi:hypothetical protein [Mycobacterium sp. SMC-4]|uniref:hypothetical protein n=1 Tax=Mycobacterium sp. SMC-4 TaxID=2857059 RepID=UPI003D01D4BB
MTVTAEPSTNMPRTNSDISPSDKLEGLLNAYRHSFMQFEHKTGMLQNSTLGFSTDTGEKRKIAASRSNSLAKEHHAEILRTVINRFRAQQQKSSESPAMPVAGMEKWEGRVLEVDDEYFTAELIPFGDGAVVIADFSWDLLPEEDQVGPGDIVYVTVRTVADIGGPTRTSAVRTRRMGTWTESEITEQAMRAKERLSELAPYFD